MPGSNTSPSPHTPSPTGAGLSATRRSSPSQPQTDTGIKLIPSTLYERSAVPKASWLVDGLIPKAATTILGGMEGTFKTWLMLELCYARGASLFGQFPVSQGKTLYLDGENGEIVMHERVKLAASRAAEPHPLFYFAHLLGQPLTEDTTKRIIPVCVKQGIDLVVVDPLRQFLVGNENDSEIMGQFCRLLSLFHEKGIATICQHHERKPDLEFRSQGTSTTSLRGSTALSAHASSILQLEIKQGHGIKVSHTKSRRGARLDPFIVTVAPGPVFGYGGPAPDDIFYETQKAAQDILKLLQLGPLFREAIIEQGVQLGYSERNMNRGLSLLNASNAIQKSRNGRKVQYALNTWSTAIDPNSAKTLAEVEQ